jgi:hypothetical protein
MGSLELLLEGMKKRDPAPSGDYDIIAKVMVSMAYQGYTEQKGFKYFRFDGSDQDATKAQAECNDYLEGTRNRPTRGIITTIYTEDNLTHSFRFQNDWIDFVSDYFQDDICLDDLPDDQRALVTAPMPYTLLMNRLHELSEAGKSSFTEQPTFCRISEEINQWRKVKEGKRKYIDKEGNPKEADYRIFVIKDVYGSKKEAQAVANKLQSSQVTGQSATGQPTTVQLPTEEMSAKAIKAWTTLDNLKTVESEINAKIGAGTPIMAVCAEYMIERSDLDLLKEVEVPF